MNIKIPKINIFEKKNKTNFFASKLKSFYL